MLAVILSRPAGLINFFKKSLFTTATFWKIFRAFNNNRTKALLAIMPTAATQFVVFFSVYNVKEERPFFLFSFAHSWHKSVPFKRLIKNSAYLRTCVGRTYEANGIILFDKTSETYPDTLIASYKTAPVVCLVRRNKIILLTILCKPIIKSFLP